MVKYYLYTNERINNSPVVISTLRHTSDKYSYLDSTPIFSLTLIVDLA